MCTVAVVGDRVRRHFLFRPSPFSSLLMSVHLPRRIHTAHINGSNAEILFTISTEYQFFSVPRMRADGAFVIKDRVTTRLLSWKLYWFDIMYVFMENVSKKKINWTINVWKEQKKQKNRNELLKTFFVWNVVECS